jgi:CO/xanthine dehydrogenase FAD-binding subunit
MIPNNFTYYRPGNLAEAIEAYTMADKDGLNPLYLAGGTEITTFCRQGTIKPGALIDIKRIPECRCLDEEGDDIIFGSALTLNEVVESGSYPLLSRVARIVDHTVRNRLTLGGNIAGRLPYRETVLPFLLADGRVRLSGPGGERVVPLSDIFLKRLKLSPGELLVQLLIPKEEAVWPWHYCREVMKTRIDYPLVMACFLGVNGAIRMAVTGAYGFPLRAGEVEAVLNDSTVRLAEKPARALAAIPYSFSEDMRAGGPYRQMLLKRSIAQALEELC